jgi:hypothetical protein
MNLFNLLNFIVQKHAESRVTAGIQMCHDVAVWPGRRFIVDPLLTRPRLWFRLPPSRECHSLREFCLEVCHGE